MLLRLNASAISKKELKKLTKGKQWTNEQVTELKDLVEANESLDDIASKLGKSTGAIYIKCQRLGLALESRDQLDPSIPLPRELPRFEQSLKMLAGGLKTAAKPGLSKSEIQRLQALANIARTYKEILEDYIDYRAIELKLREMQEQNERLLGEKTKDDATKPD